MDGFTVKTSSAAAREGDLYHGDRKYPVYGEHFRVKKDGALLANAGHFDVESTSKTWPGLRWK